MDNLQMMQQHTGNRQTFRWLEEEAARKQLYRPAAFRDFVYRFAVTLGNMYRQLGIEPTAANAVMTAEAFKKLAARFTQLPNASENVTREALRYAGYDERFTAVLGIWKTECRQG